MMQGRLRPNSLELYRLYKIVAEDGTQSARITFQGSPTQQLNVGQDVIVSFPGAYGRAWNFLTKEAAKAESGLNTSCIFLPNSSAPGYGQHIRTGRDGQMCHCMHLYHGQKLGG